MHTLVVSHSDCSNTILYGPPKSQLKYYKCNKTAALAVVGTK